MLSMALRRSSTSHAHKKKMEPIPGGDGIGSEKPGDLGGWGDAGRAYLNLFQGFREEETAAAANPCLLRSDTQWRGSLSDWRFRNV